MNESKLLSAGVYPMFLRSRITDYTGSEFIRDKVKRYFRYIEGYATSDKPKGHGIMFYGSPVTSGTDLLINTIVKKAILSGHTAKLLSIEEILTRYKESNFSHGQLLNIDFLCITGFGSNPSAFEKKVMFQVFSDRYYHQRATSLLSTIPLMDGETSILSFYGEEIAEMIDHRCLVLECAVSRRKKEELTTNVRTEIFGE